MNEVRINRADLDRAVFGPSGHVTRYFERVGKKATAEAQSLAPHGETGFLASQIGYYADRFGIVLYCSADYAVYVHEGASAHEIRAVNFATLKFYRGGAWRYPIRVWHPGNQRPNPFLRDGLRAATGLPIEG